MPATPAAHGRLHEFVSRLRQLTDEERLAVAQARSHVNESFHQRALRAAAEALVGRCEEYVWARAKLALAHVPSGLEDEASPDEVARLENVARLVQLAIDDGLLAVITSDRLHPNHARELHRSLKHVFEA